MGISTITATRFLVGQSKGKQGEETVLSWELFPWTALAKTYAVNLQGTDSASSATAFLNGIKTNEGTFTKYLGGKWYTLREILHQPRFQDLSLGFWTPAPTQKPRKRS